MSVQGTLSPYLSVPGPPRKIDPFSRLAISAAVRILGSSGALGRGFAAGVAGLAAGAGAGFAGEASAFLASGFCAEANVATQRANKIPRAVGRESCIGRVLCGGIPKRDCPPSLTRGSSSPQDFV